MNFKMWGRVKEYEYSELQGYQQFAISWAEWKAMGIDLSILFIFTCIIYLLFIYKMWLLQKILVWISIWFISIIVITSDEWHVYKRSNDCHKRNHI